MAKKVTGSVKLQIPAGKATPAPPVGTALGPQGVNIMEFCKAFNAKTSAKDQEGLIIPVVITIYSDRSFTFITKTPPVPVLIKRACRPGQGIARAEQESRRQDHAGAGGRDRQDQDAGSQQLRSEVGHGAGEGHRPVHGRRRRLDVVSRTAGLGCAKTIVWSSDPRGSCCKHWKLTAIAVFSLSIAMALGVISLSVSNTFLLLPPAAPEPDRLVKIYSRTPTEPMAAVSYPDYKYYRENNHVFTDIAAAPNSIRVNSYLRRRAARSRSSPGRFPTITSR